MLCTPDFFWAAGPKRATSGVWTHRRRAGWQRRCDTVIALRYSIPHEGGDKAQWRRRLLRAGRRRAARNGKLPRPPKTGALIAPVFAFDHLINPLINSPTPQ